MGKGDEYAQAMREYASAKAWQQFGANAWQFVKKAAPYGAGSGWPDGTLAPARLRTLEWTGGDHLRHSRFAGLREDKDARTVIKEHEGAA